MHVTAIIAAGGHGARFGASQPKQLLLLGGRPILERAVEAFLASPLVGEVIVALPASVLAEPPAYLQRPRVRLVAGGETRRASVAAAVAHVPAASDLVAIHDAARPLVSAGLIARTIDAATRTGAAIAALPIHDTVKRGGAGGVIVETVPRAGLFGAQTPQVFGVDVLRRALAGA
ncbi:MAG: 2-C-methyl-D-erythritol 4-phosphate cytidylyltransferase, partial [Vicinamibacterales bacterium]